jgi:uncharacterized radical SAM superfamily protein
MMQNQIAPRDEYWGYSKVPEELEPKYLSWVQFPQFKTPNDIPQYMSKHEIPLINFFHVGVEDFEKVLPKLKDAGVKTVLHQTIHWKDDAVTKSTISIVLLLRQSSPRVCSLEYVMFLPQRLK